MGQCVGWWCFWSGPQSVLIDARVCFNLSIHLVNLARSFITNKIAMACQLAAERVWVEKSITNEAERKYHEGPSKVRVYSWHRLAWNCVVCVSKIPPPTALKLSKTIRAIGLQCSTTAGNDNKRTSHTNKYITNSYISSLIRRKIMLYICVESILYWAVHVQLFNDSQIK